VRYSRKSDSEGEQPKERLSIPLLNRTRFKTYTHADAEKVISSILLNKLNFNDGSSGEIRNRGELAEKLYLALNTAEKGKPSLVAFDKDMKTVRAASAYHASQGFDRLPARFGGEHPRFFRSITHKLPKDKADPKAPRKLSATIEFFEWRDGKAVDITKR